MAKLEMKHIELIALQNDAKSIIEFLQRSGVVEINQRPDKEHRTADAADESLVHLHTHANITYFDKTLQLVNSSLAALNEYSPAKKSMLASFTGRRELTLSEFSQRAHKVEEALHKAREISALSQKIEAAKVVISHTRAQLEAMIPWENLDIPMRFPGTTHTTALIGSLPTFYTENTLLAALQEAAESQKTPEELPPVSLSIVSSSRELTCIVVICHRSDVDHVWGTLRKIGLSIPSDPTNHPPAVRIGRLRKRFADTQAEIDAAVLQLAGHENDRDSLLFLSDYFLMRKDKYEALGRLFFSRKTFILNGYIPERNVKGLEEALLSKFDVSVTFRDTEDSDDVPVLLKNSAFVSPVEDIVQSYSLPSKYDLDPNPAMAFFYYLFFGMMLSDAGYGVRKGR